MKRLLMGVIFMTLFFSAFSQKPKLVVGIIVDQMKQEYLYRFESKYGEDGFKRMISEGFMAKNMNYNYIPTKTAAGHASVYTGTTPRYHGIIGNEWYNKELGRGSYCVGDENEETIGGSEYAGHVSPRNLQSTTITDELKLTTNFKSKVVGVSIKDRGAALPAGHHPDGAYWYDSKTGNFVTSTFYTDVLPEWVQKFNDQKKADQYLSGKWETLYPIEKYTESTADNNAYEGGFKGKATPTFPYDLSELRTSNGPYKLISSTPFGNSIVADIAMAAVEGEKLGADEVTDFLAVSFSSTDYVGHNFGPNSIELEDTYLRLDKTIAELLAYLDKKVGKGNYTVFLTADHAVVANPIFLSDNGMPGGYSQASSFEENLKSLLNEQFGEGDWINSISNEQVFFNHTLIKEKAIDLEEITATTVDYLQKHEAMMEVYTSNEIKSISSADKLGTLLANGHNANRSGDIMFVLLPGYLFNEYGTTGTTHGSGHVYDTNVPMLWFGAGIKHGSSVRLMGINDIAPTLSMMLNVSLPNACTGQPIQELFD